MKLYREGLSWETPPRGPSPATHVKARAGTRLMASGCLNPNHTSCTPTEAQEASASCLQRFLHHSQAQTQACCLLRLLLTLVS